MKHKQPGEVIHLFPGGDGLFTHFTRGREKLRNKTLSGKGQAGGQSLRREEGGGEEKEERKSQRRKEGEERVRREGGGAERGLRECGGRRKGEEGEKREVGRGLLIKPVVGGRFLVRGGGGELTQLISTAGGLKERSDLLLAEPWWW